MADLQAKLRAWTRELNDCDSDDNKECIENVGDYLGDRDKGKIMLCLHVTCLYSFKAVFMEYLRGRL